MHTKDTVEKIAIDKLMNEQALKVLDLYGEKIQASIVCEELLELLTAIFHYDRNKIDKKELISELADAEIMLTQLKYILCDTSEEYTEVLKTKLEKQKGYIIEEV